MRYLLAVGVVIFAVAALMGTRARACIDLQDNPLCLMINTPCPGTGCSFSPDPCGQKFVKCSGPPLGGYPQNGTDGPTGAWETIGNTGTQKLCFERDNCFCDQFTDHCIVPQFAANVSIDTYAGDTPCPP